MTSDDSQPTFTCSDKLSSRALSASREGCPAQDEIL